MLLLKKGSLVREFVSKINIPNISSNPLGFKRNFCGQACSLNPKTSIYKLLDSFIVQIGSVIKSLRRRFLVCSLKFGGCAQNSDNPLGGSDLFPKANETT